MYSCEFCKIFKNTFFTEHFRGTASIFCNLNKIIQPSHDYSQMQPFTGDL